MAVICKVYTGYHDISENTVFFLRYKIFFSFKNNPKNLDPSYKMDLDLWDCLGRVKFVL